MNITASNGIYTAQERGFSSESKAHGTRIDSTKKSRYNGFRTVSTIKARGLYGSSNTLPPHFKG